MIFLVYNILLTFLLVLASPYFFLRSLIQKEFREALPERMGFFKIPSLGSPIWVHAASVGEVFCSMPVLKRVKKEFPKGKIILSTMTSTGNKTAKTNLPEADQVLFVPVDHPLFVKRTIKKIQPSLLLVAETELWPNLLRSCGKKGIPIVLFNGRISQRSFQRYVFFKFFFKKCLKSISLFLMQTEEDRTRIIEIGADPPKTRVVGNLKFDQTFPDFSREATEELAKALGLRGEEKVFIAGSTHAGEEEVLISLYKELKKTNSPLVLILAPRHLERLDEVEKILRKESVSWVRKSSLPLRAGGLDQTTPEVILVDTIGELMTIYSLGTLVFVGGSLVPIGGHNPLEPLFHRKCVLFGPYMLNFFEISQRLIEAGGAIRVSGKQELSSQLRRLLLDESAREEVGERGYQFLKKQQGATERMFEEIRPYLCKMRNADCGMRNL
jgi:3-deoxy-D-manno-octulosonic-acid transferase